MALPPGRFPLARLPSPVQASKSVSNGKPLPNGVTSLLSALILYNGFPTAANLVENDIRGRLPFKGLGFVVPVGEPLVDRAFQFIDAMEGPAADHAIGDETE